MVIEKTMRSEELITEDLEILKVLLADDIAEKIYPDIANRVQADYDELEDSAFEMLQNENVGIKEMLKKQSLPELLNGSFRFNEIKTNMVNKLSNEQTYFGKPKYVETNYQMVMTARLER